MIIETRASLYTVGAALALSVAGCGQQQSGQDASETADTSAQPEMTQPAPDDSTYSASAGRTEDTSASTASAMGTPSDFLVNAAQTDMLEIQAGKLASEKGQSPEVKKFADMLVQDHGQASKELQQIAQQKGVQVPQSLPPDKQQSLQKLEGMSGQEFDRTFAQEMVNGHQQAVQMYEQAAQSAQDPEIRAFAEEKLPTLREHLKMAQALPGADNRG